MVAEVVRRTGERFHHRQPLFAITLAPNHQTGTRSSRFGASAGQGVQSGIHEGFQYRYGVLFSAGDMGDLGGLIAQLQVGIGAT